MATLTYIPPETDYEAYLRAEARRRIQQREEEAARARREESSTSSHVDEARIREATRSTAHWLRNYTRTYNPHWVEEGRPFPNEPFPDWWFFDPLLEMVEQEPISAVEKSRDMMVSWALVGYFTLQAQTVPQREIIFQTLTDAKVEQLIEYAKTLYGQQPTWLKEAFPLAKPIEKQSANELVFANGSQILGIAGGKGKVRSYHPWGFFNDETSFQPEAGHCLDEALGTGAQKIVMASTANVSWFQEWRNDSLV